MLEGILDSSDDAVAALDRELQCLYVNAAICRQLGKTKHELVGQPMDKALAGLGDLCSLWRRQALEVFRQGKTVHPRASVVLAGWSRHIQSTVSPTLDAKGRVVAVTIAFRDVTPQIDAAEALDKSHRRYRELIEGVDDVIVTMDARGILDYVSPQAGRYGFDPAKLAGVSFIEFIHAADRPRVMKAFAEEIASGRETRMQFRVPTPDGRVVWVENCTKIQRDAAGKINGLFVILRDVTERQQSEAALRESEEKLRSVMAAAQSAIILVNGGGRISLWNAAAERIFGYAVGEAMGARCTNSSRASRTSRSPEGKSPASERRARGRFSARSSN